MVASATIASAPPSARAASRRSGVGRVRFTVDDALRMVASGILPEDASIELLNGELVFVDRGDSTTARGDEAWGSLLESWSDEAPMESFDHNRTIVRLTKLAPAINNERRHLRTQSTIRCSETYMPVPDAVILNQSIDGFATGFPIAADADCIIEVADSSYARDAGVKLAAYARAGAPQYVIVNLRNRTAEVYATPDRAAGTYALPTIVPADGTLALRVGDAGETFEVAMADVLPAA